MLLTEMTIRIPSSHSTPQVENREKSSICWNEATLSTIANCWS